MSSSNTIKLLIDPGTWDPMDEDTVFTDPIEFHSNMPKGRHNQETRHDTQIIRIAQIVSLKQSPQRRNLLLIEGFLVSYSHLDIRISSLPT